MPQFGTGYTQRNYFWVDFKNITLTKSLSIQYEVNQDGSYLMWGYDPPETHICTIWDGYIPQSLIDSGSYSQSQNDSDKLDFLTNFESKANAAITPRSSDGRNNVLPTLFPSIVQMTIVGAGDDPILGNGKGTAFYSVSNDGYLAMPIQHTIVWQHNDYIYLAGGQISYENAIFGDSIDYYIYAPPTIVTIASGYGNCNLTGPGNVLIVPGMSTNTNVDLTQAIPVPNLTNTGFWDWIAPANGIGNGTIVPNLIQAGGYNLYTIQIVLTHPVTSMQLNGSHVQDLIIPALIPRKVLPQWRHQTVITNGGHDNLQITWLFTIARVHNT